MEFIPQVNEKVYYGREHGERTLGVVIKVNRSAAKIKQLEKRGGHPVGTVWTVPFALILEAGRQPVNVPPVVDELTALRNENAALRAENEKLRSRTAHVRVASSPAIPAVRPKRSSRVANGTV